MPASIFLLRWTAVVASIVILIDHVFLTIVLFQPTASWRAAVIVRCSVNIAIRARSRITRFVSLKATAIGLAGGLRLPETLWLAVVTAVCSAGT